MLVLAGDIGIGSQGLRLAVEQSRRRPVLYVPGNHEYYGQDLASSPAVMRRALAGSGVHLLDRNAVVIQGVRFLGCTLWTDFRAVSGAQAGDHMAWAMAALNDFEHIRMGSRTLHALDTVAEHLRSRAWLEDQLAANHAGPTVVITHHAPVRLAFPRWPLKNPAVVAASVNRMEALMDGNRVHTWIYGHTHWALERRVRGTRLLSNPRGYPARPVPGFVPHRVVEI